MTAFHGLCSPKGAGIVMPALVAGIDVLNLKQIKDLDGRNKVRP